MHKNFNVINIKKLNNLNYELILYREGIIYKLDMESNNDYINTIRLNKEIDLKDDSWLDEHLIEIRKTIFYHSKGN